MGGVPACGPQGCRFDPVGPMPVPGLQARPLAGGVGEAADGCMFCTSIFPSLFSPCFALSQKISKRFIIYLFLSKNILNCISFFRFYLFIFREREKEGERKGEK